MRGMGILVGPALFTLGGCVLVYGDLRDYAGAGGSGGSGGGGGGCTTSGTVEVCGNDVDEDCDGTKCNLTADWSVRLSGSGEETVGGVALTNTGAVLLAGSYSKDITFDTLPLSAGPQAYTAASEANGTPKWLNDGMLPGAVATGIVFDTTTNNAAAFAGWVNNGGTGKDAFATKVDLTGKMIWNNPKLLDWPGDQEAAAVAFDGSANVFVVGTTSGPGTATCNGMVNLDPGPDGKALFVAKIDGITSDCMWAKVFKGGTSEPKGAIFLSSIGGYLYVAGNYTGTIAGTKVPDAKTAGGAFVLALDSSGNLQWSTGFVGSDATSTVKAFGVAAADDGHLYVTGLLAGKAVIGDTMLQSTEGSEDTLVFALDGSLEGKGTPLWAERFGGGSKQQGSAIGVRDGAVFVAGRAEDAMSADPKSDAGVLCTGSGGLFLLKLDSTKKGEPVWGGCFGAETLDPKDSVALSVDASSLVLGMSRKGPIDFGQGSLSGGSLDVVVAKFSSL